MADKPSQQAVERAWRLIFQAIAKHEAAAKAKADAEALEMATGGPKVVNSTEIHKEATA